MNDNIQIYFVYAITDGEDIKPVAFDADSPSHTLKTRAKLYSAPYLIPLKSSLGSGHVISFPSHGAKIVEFGIQMPDIDRMIADAKAQGREEFKDELRSLGMKKLKDILYPSEPDYEYED